MGIAENGLTLFLEQKTSSFQHWTSLLPLRHSKATAVQYITHHCVPQFQADSNAPLGSGFTCGLNKLLLLLSLCQSWSPVVGDDPSGTPHRRRWRPAATAGALHGPKALRGGRPCRVCGGFRRPLWRRHGTKWAVECFKTSFQGASIGPVLPETIPHNK